MTKMFCDRCGAETTHSQEHVFAPGYYAGTSHVKSETGKMMGKPHVYDVCHPCEKAAVQAFTDFMLAGDGPLKQAELAWQAQIAP